MTRFRNMIVQIVVVSPLLAAGCGGEEPASGDHSRVGKLSGRLAENIRRGCVFTTKPAASSWRHSLLPEFTEAAEHRLNSLPEDGGTPSVLAAELPAFLWAEADDLIFAHYADRLMRVPFAGGTPTPLQDGGFCTAHATANCRGLLLDDSYLYFNSHSVQDDAPMSPTVVRRMARATGRKTNWPRCPAVSPATTCGWSAIRC